MTDTEAKLIVLLEKIVSRAHRPIKAQSTDHLTRAVPAGLLDQASELLASRGR
jgi:hypothetical protein